MELWYEIVAPQKEVRESGAAKPDEFAAALKRAMTYCR